MYSTNLNAILTAAGWLAVCTPTLAITNIENERPQAHDQQGLSGHLELSFSGKNGNNKEQDYGAAVKLSYRRGAHQLLFIGAKDYGKSRGVKDDDSDFEHLRWIFPISHHENIQGELFLQYQSDEFLQLNSRTLGGAGLRFTMWNTPNQSVAAIGAGGFRVKEKLDLVTHEDTQLYSRYNTYFSWFQKANQQVTLSSTLYYQPRMGDHHDYRILLEASLSTKMTDKLAMKLKYTLEHDSQPPENPDSSPEIKLNETDIQYSLGLNYQF